MSASLSQKSQTKLKTFLKEKEKPAKRFKSLVSFIGTPPRKCSVHCVFIDFLPNYDRISFFNSNYECSNG